MPEGRFLHRKIAVSEQLARASYGAEAFFYRCIPHLDVEGRLQGKVTLLKGAVAPDVLDDPGLDKYPLHEIENLLAELEALELVKRYEVDGVRVVLFPGFTRSQAHHFRADREAVSRLPAPPAPGRRSRSRSTPEPIRPPGSGGGPEELPPRKERSEGRKYLLPTDRDAPPLGSPGAARGATRITADDTGQILARARGGA